MTSLFSYLVTIFAGIFWLVRLVIAITYTMSVDIGIEPINFDIEVALLFITLFCMIFVVKRNLLFHEPYHKIFLLNNYTFLLVALAYL